MVVKHNSVGSSEVNTETSRSCTKKEDKDVRPDDEVSRRGV